MQAIDYAKALIKGKFLRIVMPEAGDERIRAAASILQTQELAVPVLFGPDVPDPTPAQLDLVRARRPKMTEAMAVRLLRKPLYLAASMVATGDAAAMVAGAINPTARVIEAGEMMIGLAPGICHAFQLFSHAVARTPPDLCRLRRERAAHGRATGRHRHCFRRECRQNTGRGAASGHAVILNQGQRLIIPMPTRSWPPCRSSASVIPKF